LFKGKNTVSLTESTINNKIGKTENKKKKGHFASLFALKGRMGLASSRAESKVDNLWGEKPQGFWISLTVAF